MSRSRLLLVLPALFGLAAAQQVNLTGAGASFPYPLYGTMFSVYQQETGVKVNYGSIGSGGGQKQLQEKTVNFGASDAPLSDEQMANYPGKVLHVPTALGAVVATYNLPGLEAPLKLNGEVLAKIFLGEIKTWNDPALLAINEGAKLPPLPITVVHRSDGSGTTFAFVEYLSKVSPAWKEQVGVGTAVEWPTGLGGKGNEGVTGSVGQTPGAIGYVELIYAVQNKLAYASVQNQSGEFIVPELASVEAAGEIDDFPADTRVSLTDTPNPEGYPITTLTWILVYEDQEISAKSQADAKALADLLWWMTHEGQEQNEKLDYGRLPDIAVERSEALIQGMKYQGQPLR